VKGEYTELMVLVRGEFTLVFHEINVVVWNTNDAGAFLFNDTVSGESYLQMLCQLMPQLENLVEANQNASCKMVHCYISHSQFIMAK
jgi:hypothetical protein